MTTTSTATAAAATPTTAASNPTPVPPTPVPPTAVPTAAGPLTATVNLNDSTFRFSPASVTIAVGGTVTWQWQGGVFHDVSSTDFASDLMKAGSFSHTFSAAGTYSYECTVHKASGMRGTVTVQ